MQDDQNFDENGNPNPNPEEDPQYPKPPGMQEGVPGTKNPGEQVNGFPKAAPAPVGAFNRESFKNDWLGTNAHNSADMDSFLQSHPEYAQSVSRSGKDVWSIKDPRGQNERVDALFDESGPSSRASWTDPGGQGGGGGGGGGVGSLPPGGAAGVSGTGSGVYGTGNPQMDTAMHDALMSMLTRNSKPITAGDMADRFGPLDAIKQRNAQESRHAAAERSTYQGANVGGAGGSLDAEQNKISEKLSSDEQGLMAGLMTDEMTARRQDVMNALQFAQGEEKITLQKQLADMDNQIQREGMNQRNSQYYAGLGQNQSQFDTTRGDSNAWKEYQYNQMFNQELGA